MSRMFTGLDMHKPWLKERGSGFLLHVSALPSASGTGNLGVGSRKWLNFLKSCGQNYWQVLPVGPTGFGNSPYSSLSAFAGNPLLLDFEGLVDLGLLKSQNLKVFDDLPHDRVNFKDLELSVNQLLEKSYKTFIDSDIDEIPLYGSYSVFRSDNAFWLDDYCLYRALKTRFEQKPWYEWPADFRDIEKAREQKLTLSDQHYVQFHAFQQYLFEGQWKLLLRDAHEQGIGIIGDTPIFVSHDSADTWSNPDIFALKADGQVEFRAGVPPDYFSSTGQLWGNPVYRWDVLKSTGYDWWMKRLQRDLSRFSHLRLDHFRAFHNYWSIPDSAESARTGTWEAGPGLPFFNELHSQIPEPRIIAEDLGEMVPEVYELRDATGFPGMKVLQFAFFGDPKNPHLPHNYDSANCVVFPGTHDNNTSAGWYASAPESIRDNYRRYLGVDGGRPSWDLIRAASGSVARLALYSMQDVLGLGTAARFNTPGVAAGNWSWRCTRGNLDRAHAESAEHLMELMRMHGRLPGTNESS